jgi:predicted CopG family antitoxin
MSMNCKTITISEHAYERAKERLKWKRKTIKRMANLEYMVIMYMYLLEQN